MQKIVFLMAIAASFAMSACNTVSGAGEDMQAAGSAVEEAAEDAAN